MRYISIFLVVSSIFWTSAKRAEVLALPGPQMCGQLASAPSIPDGATASERAMISAIDKVKAYSRQVNQFLDCNETKRYDIFDRLSPADQSRWSDEFDALIDALRAVETDMNEQIAKFNAR